MKRILMLIAALSMLLLSACATMDLTTLETAVPLGKNHLNVSAFQGLGVDLETTVYNEGETEYLDTEDRKASADIVTGLKLAYGFTPDMDFVGRAYIGSASQGFKVGIKKLIQQDKNGYLALMPMVTRIQATVEETTNSEEQTSEYTSNGLELNVIYTQYVSKHVYTSVIARGNVNHFIETIDELEAENHIAVHGGVRGNVFLKLGPFVLMPELGVELVPVKNGDITMLPAVGLSFGLQF